MRRRYAVAAFVCVLALFYAIPLNGVEQPPEPEKKPKPGKEPLVDQVRRSIDRGVQFLKNRENNGNIGDIEHAGYPGGPTSLALLALLTAGVEPDDPVIERGLEHLRKIQPNRTYVVGLQTMAFAAAGKEKDHKLIQRNVDWLVNNFNPQAGWGYTGKGGDNSNNQYALLGLQAGSQAGAKIDPRLWEAIRDFYLGTQEADGGWGYVPTPKFNNWRGNMPRGMPRQQPSQLNWTVAGLCGLYIVGSELSHNRETIRPDGSALHCGKYKDDEALAKAHNWIDQNFQLAAQGKFGNIAGHYGLYGIERAGRMSGHRFLGTQDWYREGCEQLVKSQKADGSWGSAIDTSFALLFLSKGRTPVLISKLTHGPGDDWNNDRYDIRNLVEYAGKEVFKKQLLAWQIFDAKKIPVENHDDLLDLTADLLQSPIVYINGHKAPQFTKNEEALLKEYLEQGGFVLAEACCGSKEFDKGFRDLVKRLFPDSNLEPLPPEHAIWRAHAVIDPRAYPLEGLSVGCKTALVYSPKDLSCLWEANRRDNVQGLQAFRLGGNIIAYATGMEPPKPRLTEVEVAKIKDDPKKVPRGFLKVGQVRHDGDWQPAPRAMRNLMHHLREKNRLDVALQAEPLRLDHPDLPDFKFLYMQGRNAFTFSEEEIKNLRANLQTNGLLLADASCGRATFDKAFREFLVKLFPDKPLERIPLTDDLFGKELNSEAIVKVRRRECGEARNGVAAGGFEDVEPFLEGIKHNGRWVVIYSRYDLGCALEKQQSSDCKGHDYDSALRLGSAVVLYALKR